MSRYLPNKIRTQKFEVEFENAPDVFEFRNHLADVCRNDLLPALERLFDEMIKKNQILSVDRIFIDVGILEKDGWEISLVQSVIEQLRQYIGQTLSESFYQERKKGQTSDDWLLFDESSESSNDLGVRIRENDLQPEVFIYYLKKGVLPWHVEFQNREELQSRFAELIKSNNGFRKAIHHLAGSNEKVFQRLVLQFEEACVLSVLLSENEQQTGINKFRESWKPIFRFLKIPHSRQRLFFYEGLRNCRKENAADLTTEIVKLLKADQVQLLVKLLNDNEEMYQFKPDEKKILKQIAEISERHFGSQKVSSKEKERRNQRDADVTEYSEPLFIDNAGLVLLHPFLKNLFENVGYTTQNKWISEDVHERALLLTQYLVDGESEYGEYEMFLNKTLIGYPTDKTFSSDIALSEFEREEADDLLQAVINHWSALKNTSIAGLQTTFMQREGKLTANDTGWLLQVEQKAFDILLEKIPWGFSTIKTPWMKEIVNVEWA